MLWDTKTNTIVNNESAEIMRMLNSEFNAFARHPDDDYYPAELRREIDELNTLIYALSITAFTALGSPGSKTSMKLRSPTYSRLWTRSMSACRNDDTSAVSTLPKRIGVYFQRSFDLMRSTTFISNAASGE